MITEETKKVIVSEILENPGYINIDNSDIDSFKRELKKIDHRSFECSINEVELMFKSAFLSATDDNRVYELSRVLFVIKLSSEHSFTIENMTFVNEVIGDCIQDIDCLWGMSIDDRVPREKIKIVVLNKRC